VVLTHKVKLGFSIGAGIISANVIPTRYLLWIFADGHASSAIRIYCWVALPVGVAWTAYWALYKRKQGREGLLWGYFFGFMATELLWLSAYLVEGRLSP
jgi:hypothetical protein